MIHSERKNSWWDVWKLGYKKPEDTIFNIEKFVKTIGKTKYCIAFDYFYRRISVFTFEDRESRKDITMQELQAINKKVEELFRRF